MSHSVSEAIDIFDEILEESELNEATSEAAFTRRLKKLDKLVREEIEDDLYKISQKEFVSVAKAITKKYFKNSKVTDEGDSIEINLGSYAKDTIYGGYELGLPKPKARALKKNSLVFIAYMMFRTILNSIGRMEWGNAALSRR